MKEKIVTVVQGLYEYWNGAWRRAPTSWEDETTSHFKSWIEKITLKEFYKNTYKIKGIL